jgi:hypothetical protein
MEMTLDDAGREEGNARESVEIGKHYEEEGLVEEDI